MSNTQSRHHCKREQMRGHKFSKRGITASITESVIPRQRDLSDAISSHEFHQALSLADPRTRARWISETGAREQQNGLFVLPSKKNGHAYTPTEFRTLVRWWLGEQIYPGPRSCPMEKCTQPLGPEGDHALACKSGHGITSRHNALAAEFSSECSKAGFTTQREMSLGNKGPGHLRSAMLPRTREDNGKRLTRLGTSSRQW